MDRKLIIIIVVLVLVLGGGFLAYKYWPTDIVGSGDSQEVNTNTSLPGNGGNGSTPGGDGEPSITQIETNYLEVPFLEGLSDQDLFLLQRSDNYLALSNQNNICQRKDAEQEKNDCLATLMIRQVSVLDKAELCAQVPNSKRDLCYRNMAFKHNDLELCPSIDNQADREDCENQLTKMHAQKDKNVLLCLNLNDDSKEQCIRGVFSGETDVAYCDTGTVRDNDLADICKSVIYVNQAFAQKDNSICEQVPLTSYRDACFSELSGLSEV